MEFNRLQALVHDSCSRYHAVKNKDIEMTDSFLIRKLGEEYGELCQAIIEGHLDGAHEELADVFNIVCLIGLRWGIDLQQEVIQKLGVLSERTARSKMKPVQIARAG